MIVNRRHDWPQRLAAFLAAERNTPFAWGRHDCALFVCDVIEEMTGLDLARDFRGEYHSRREAVVKMRAFAGEGLEAVVEKRCASYEMQELAGVAYAAAGDVALFDTEHGPQLAIVAPGGQAAVTLGPNGLVHVPVLRCRRAWRVG